MKRATAAVLLSGLFALLTLGLSGCGNSSSAPPSIGVALTPNGTKGIDQAQTVSITAAVANDSKSAGVTWSVSGTNGSQGTLTNTTTTSATYNAPASVTSAFTATVTAASVTDTTKVAVLKITVSPLPSITTTSLAAATPGTAYSATMVETGGTSPYTWTVTPATLPAGLSLNSSTGVISGMPTGGGSGQFTFKVTDAAGESASSPAITFTVAAPPALTVTTATLPAAVMGTAYSQTLQATGSSALHLERSAGNSARGIDFEQQHWSDQRHADRTCHRHHPFHRNRDRRGDADARHHPRRSEHRG